MSNQIIPYKEAKTLKKLGFNYSTHERYYEGELEIDYGNWNSWGIEHITSAPTYEQVFEWFSSIENTKWPIETWIQPYLSKEPRKYEAMYWRRGETKSIGKYSTRQEAKLKSLRKLIKITNDLINQE